MEPDIAQSGGTEQGNGENAYLQVGGQNEANDGVGDEFLHWHEGQKHRKADDGEDTGGDGEAGREPGGHDGEESVDGIGAKEQYGKRGDGRRKAIEDRTEEKYALHLRVLALFGKALRGTPEEAVCRLGDDVELKAEHADCDSGGNADARLLTRGDGNDGANDGGSGIVGDGGSSHGRHAQAHELDDGADGEAGYGVAERKSDEPCWRDGHVRENLSRVLLGSVDEGDECNDGYLDDGWCHKFTPLLKRDDAGELYGLVGRHIANGDVAAGASNRSICGQLVFGDVGATAHLDGV